MLRKRLYFITIILIILLGIGTVFYSYAEGWSFIDSFYFSTITLTTIGYGDLAPTTDVTKIFTAFYAIFGIGIMLYVLSSVIGAFVFKQEINFENKIFSPHKLNRDEKEKKQKTPEQKKYKNLK